ncbi:MAG: type II and III secretion system protein family protein [Sumerlaeia bacterium]
MKRITRYSTPLSGFSFALLALVCLSEPIAAQTAETSLVSQSSNIQFSVPPKVSSGGSANRLFAPPSAARPMNSSTASGIRSLTEDEEKKYSSTIKQKIATEKNLDLIIGRPQLLVFKSPPLRIQLADDEIATINTISATELSVTSVEPGTSVLNIWFEKEGSPYEAEVLSYLIRSFPDPEDRSRTEFMYQSLQNELNVLFADSDIQLISVGDKLVVKGKANDFVEAAQILRIVESQASTQSSMGIPFETNLDINFNDPDVSDLPKIRNYLISGSSNIINMLQVPAEKQIQLKVTVAEVNRSAARSIGFNFSLTNKSGIITTGNNTGNLLNGAANVPFSYVHDVNFQAALRALRNLNFAKSLAEPTLVTINGKEASFRTGGSFPIPVVTGNTSSGLQGVTFQNFGVNLSFTPYTLTDNKIRLMIDGSVTSRNEGGGGTIQQTNIPGLDERTFNTTVELNEGQTLAIAGILQTETRAQSTNIPFFGDLPLIGRLFGNSETTSQEQELLVLVTPEIVVPLDYNEVPPLPGSDSFEPDDLEFYLYGRMESRAPRDFRSPVQNDFDRLRWHRLEQVYLQGPSGYSTGGNYPN